MNISLSELIILLKNNTKENVNYKKIIRSMRVTPLIKVNFVYIALMVLR
jgi:hypothetical protein